MCRERESRWGSSCRSSTEARMMTEISMRDFVFCMVHHVYLEESPNPNQCYFGLSISGGRAAPKKEQ